MSDLTTLAQLIRPDDTLRFKLFAQKVIVQEDVRLSVEVQALISTARDDRGSLEQRIRSALNAFVAAEWAFSTIHRGGATVGFERVSLMASARVPIAAIYNLEERARLASSEGLSLRETKVNYALPSQRVSETVAELRRNIVTEAKEQIAEFDQMTGRTWRIGDIVFGHWQSRNEERMAKGARSYNDDSIADLFSESEDGGMTSAERITLVGEVTLRAAA